MEVLPDRNLHVILVLGVSNSGKSTLINWIADAVAGSRPDITLQPRHVAVRESLESSTQEVKEVSINRLIDSMAGAETVLLVDTPGFDHSSLSNAEVLRRIAAWIGSRRVSSILYCHDISCDFVNPTMRLDLEVLAKVCGPGAMNIVTFVTMKWDQLSRQALGAVREEEMRQKFWSRLTAPNDCQVMRVKGSHDAMALFALVSERIEANGDPPPLKMQQELRQGGGEWSKTGAGCCLNPARKARKAEGALRMFLAGLRNALNVSAAGNGRHISVKELGDAQGSTDPVLNDAQEGDIAILVMGEVRSGKSTIIQRITGDENIEIGNKMTPCTRSVRCYPWRQTPAELALFDRELDGHRFILVDTPGFDRASDKWATLRQIDSWLRESDKRGVIVRGLLYLHDITREDLPEPSRAILKLFSRSWDDDTIKHVAFVTTKWDRLHSAEEGVHRAASLVSEVLQETGMLDRGASVYHARPIEHQVTHPQTTGHMEPRDIVRDLLAKGRDFGFPTFGI